MFCFLCCGRCIQSKRIAELEAELLESRNAAQTLNEEKDALSQRLAQEQQDKETMKREHAEADAGYILTLLFYVLLALYADLLFI